MRNRITTLVAIITLMAISAHATALTAARQTPRLVEPISAGYLQGSNVIYQGSIVAVNGSGVAVPASDATGLVVLGRAASTSINDGRDYLATRKVVVDRGVFKWVNGGTFTVTSLGAICYVSDDQTVSTAAAMTYDIPAGVIVAVDSDGVWVDTISLGRVLSGSLNALAVTGNGNVSGTFGVGGALAVTGAVSVAGAATLSGNSTVAGTLDVTGITTCSTNLAVSGNATVAGTLIGSSTIAATGFKIGAVSGWSGTVTNISTLSTNIFWYTGGVVTNCTRNP